VSTILKELDPQQKEAVTTTEGPLLIIAGAGTGKTTVIARRIAYIIEKKLARPSEILALTFTDKAAGEMEERVDQLVPYGFIDTWISTFHAFGDRVLRDNAFDIGLTPDFKVLSRPQQVLFFTQNLFRFDLTYYRPLGNPTKFIFAILSFFSRLKDENISPQDFLKFAKNYKNEDKLEIQKINELAQAFENYEKHKDEAAVLDFGDQVTKAIHLFNNRPTILKNYQEKFKYILVDEYQDTNFSQNILVKMLSNRHKNICVVGDDDQSIYKFRGAAISNIIDFKKDFKKAKQVVLTQNYRSTQAILDCSYRLIKHNDPDRLEVQNKIDKKLKSSKKNYDQSPQEIFAPTLSEEADIVADQIKKLMFIRKKSRFYSQKSGAYSSRETEGRIEKFSTSLNNNNVSQGYNYRDIAILVRANSQADFFLRALNLKGIPHKFIGASGLYSRNEIKILISFLKTISNVEDSLNLFNLLTSEIYDISQEDAIKLISFAKRKNRPLWSFLKNNSEKLFDDLEISEESQEILKKVTKDLDQSMELSKKESAGKVLYNFLTITNYLKNLDKNESVENQIKIQNIAKFFEKIKEFEQIASIESVTQFIDYLEAVQQSGDDPATVDYDPDTDAVNVMTIHSVKGLEFPVVFMVNLTSDRFPTRHRSEQIEIPTKLIKETLPVGDWHLEEERRLFYVGITRAKEKLFFTWSRDVGGKRAKKISPFVLESLDKIKSANDLVKLSPLEKIEKFATTTIPPSQTSFLDVDVLKLTQGSLDDYLTCAFKYRYVHILRLPILRHHAIVYGSALHTAVAAFNRSKKSGKLISLPQLLEVFENSWDSEGFLTIEHEEKRKTQGKLAISQFYKRESKSKNIPSLIEQPFKFSLPGVTINGRFDRVDVRAGSKIEIIDYKSSENIDQERANAQAKESIQLAIYALYYYKTHRIMPEKVSLYFLETGIISSHVPIVKDLEKTEKLILETAKNIKHDRYTNHFEANPKYFGREPACNYCAYNSICPFSVSKF